MRQERGTTTLPDGRHLMTTRIVIQIFLLQIRITRCRRSNHLILAALKKTHSFRITLKDMDGSTKQRSGLWKESTMFGIGVMKSWVGKMQGGLVYILQPILMIHGGVPIAPSSSMCCISCSKLKRRNLFFKKITFLII